MIDNTPRDYLGRTAEQWIEQAEKQNTPSEIDQIIADNFASVIVSEAHGEYQFWYEVYTLYHGEEPDDA